MLGDKALKANAGETVRLFVGNGGPNLELPFHVIGEIFDNVRPEASTGPVAENIQTTMIPPGGAAIAELKVNVPGTYIMVDHSLTRAFNKGALAQIKVTGEENKLVYSGKISDEVYQPEGANIHPVQQDQAAGPVARNKEDRIRLGKIVFTSNCAACHQPTGLGIPQAFPPLAKSDFLNADNIRAIKTVTGGRQGKLTVNGQEFDGVMPAWSLSDEDIANVLTYVYNSWGNAGYEVTPGDVKQHRTKVNDQASRL
jgi:nitrite reductase (NO-forming)